MLTEFLSVGESMQYVTQDHKTSFKCKFIFRYRALYIV